MRILWVAAALCVAGVSTAKADSTNFSYELGLIVGSAELCDYKLNDDAVSAYVEANVPGSDLGFASNFQMHVGYHRRQAEKLSGLELRVHCESARRSAEHLKLLVP
jgi:hypothetical protein